MLPTIILLKIALKDVFSGVPTSTFLRRTRENNYRFTFLSEAM